MKIKLCPFQKWMVRQNLEYVKTEGLEVVVSRLMGQGYTTVACAVREIVERQHLEM